MHGDVGLCLATEGDLGFLDDFVQRQRVVLVDQGLELRDFGWLCAGHHHFFDDALELGVRQLEDALPFAEVVDDDRRERQALRSQGRSRAEVREHFAHHDAPVHDVSTDGHTVVRQYDAAAVAIGLDNGDVEGTTAEVEDEGFLAFGGGAGISQCSGIGLGQKGKLGDISQVAGFGHAGDGRLVAIGMVRVVDRSADDHAGDGFVRDCFDAIDDLAEHNGD